MCILNFRHGQQLSRTNSKSNMFVFNIDRNSRLDSRGSSECSDDVSIVDKFIRSSNGSNRRGSCSSSSDSMGLPLLPPAPLLLKPDPLMTPAALEPLLLPQRSSFNLDPASLPPELKKSAADLLSLNR